MTTINIEPIGYIHNSRKEAEDDNWGSVLSELEIALGEEALTGIEDFSHAEIIFYLNKVDESKIVKGARYPRNNPSWPKVGILAQRNKNRPNRLGLTTVKIVSRNGNRLIVSGLDAIDETPILDIKPVMREFMPNEPIRQPKWSSELMREYWKNEKSSQ